MELISFQIQHRAKVLCLGCPWPPPGTASLLAEHGVAILLLSLKCWTDIFHLTFFCVCVFVCVFQDSCEFSSWLQKLSLVELNCLLLTEHPLSPTQAFLPCLYSLSFSFTEFQKGWGRRSLWVHPAWFLPVLQEHPEQGAHVQAAFGDFQERDPTASLDILCSTCTAQKWSLMLRENPFVTAHCFCS